MISPAIKKILRASETTSRRWRLTGMAFACMPFYSSPAVACQRRGPDANNFIWSRGEISEKDFILMRLILIIVVLSAIGLAGCNGDNNNGNGNGNGNGNANRAEFKPPPPIKPAEPVDPKFKTCNPYYPLVPGSVAKYVVNYSSGLVADATVIVDAADENGQKVFIQKTQLIDRSGGSQISQLVTRKFMCDNGVVKILSETTESNVAGQSSTIDFDYREGSVMMNDAESLSHKGTTWTHTLRTVTHTPGKPPSRSDVPTAITFEVVGPDQVTTAVGTFKAIKISRKVGQNGTVDEYVAGVGLVKRQSNEGTSWELKEFSGLKAMD
jgi:hypothetical protein